LGTLLERIDGGTSFANLENKQIYIISMILRIGDLKREHNMKKPVVFSIQKWKNTDLENKQVHHHKFVEFFP